jgi:hypothetical protein
MTEGQTTSWIFLAIAIASKTAPADYDSISNVADGINHAVPTHRELQSSLTWLRKNELVVKTGSKFKLTEKGQLDYDMASRQTSPLFEIWDNLDTILNKYQA